MRNTKLVFTIIGFLTSFFLSAQLQFKLDESNWNYDVPEGFQMENPSSEDYLVKIYKSEEDINSLTVSYLDNQNMQKLTTEVYVFALVDTFKKGYNNGNFSAEVQMERKKINEKVYYLIRSSILHIESEFHYIQDVYVAELNGKEFNVTITYDNDEDKEILEQSFYNSSFS